jgi:hypothetical protein
MSDSVWVSEFTCHSPAYEIFHWLPRHFLQKTDWPNLEDYNVLASTRNATLVNSQGLAIQFIESSASQDVEKSYESSIYFAGEVQTRKKNWHDFFNMLIWNTFPRLKAYINCLQYHELNKRALKVSQRSPLENFLTLLDENGVLIASSNATLLRLIREMKWQDAFWHHRDILLEALSCYVIGHSLHEKLLNPYIGLIGHGLLLEVEAGFFKMSKERQVLEIETRCLELDLSSLSTRSLFPIPILGLPNWFPMSVDPAFYSNENYFRTRRRCSLG